MLEKDSIYSLAMIQVTGTATRRHCSPKKSWMLGRVLAIIEETIVFKVPRLASQPLGQIMLLLSREVHCNRSCMNKTLSVALWDYSNPNRLNNWNLKNLEVRGIRFDLQNRCTLLEL